MALFTDKSVITLDDLLPYEVTLVQIASPHGINVDTKINLASSAVGDKLMLWLLDGWSVRSAVCYAAPDRAFDSSGYTVAAPLAVV